MHTFTNKPTDYCLHLQYLQEHKMYRSCKNSPMKNHQIPIISAPMCNFHWGVGEYKFHLVIYCYPPSYSDTEMHKFHTNCNHHRMAAAKTVLFSQTTITTALLHIKQTNTQLNRGYHHAQMLLIYNIVWEKKPTWKFFSTASQKTPLTTLLHQLIIISTFLICTLPFTAMLLFVRRFELLRICASFIIIIIINWHKKPK